MQYKYKPEYLENFPESEREKMATYQTGVLAQVILNLTPPLLVRKLAIIIKYYFIDRLAANWNISSDLIGRMPAFKMSFLLFFSSFIVES